MLKTMNARILRHSKCSRKKQHYTDVYSACSSKRFSLSLNENKNNYHLMN